MEASGLGLLETLRRKKGPDPRGSKPKVCQSSGAEWFVHAEGHGAINRKLVWELVRIRPISGFRAPVALQGASDFLRDSFQATLTVIDSNMANHNKQSYFLALRPNTVGCNAVVTAFRLRRETHVQKKTMLHSMQRPLIQSDKPLTRY